MTVRDSLGLPKEGIPNLIAMATPLPIPWALKGWGLAGAKQEIAATELSSANTGEYGSGYICLDSHSQACRLEWLLLGPHLPRASQTALLCNPASLPCLACPSEARWLLVRVLPLAVSPLLYHGLHAGGGNLPPRSWRPMGVHRIGYLGVGINPFTLSGSTWPLLIVPPLP